MIKMFTKKRRKGFTLIELIVVIAILGILAAIAIPKLSGFREDATTATSEANDRMIYSAISLYRARWGDSTTPTRTQLLQYIEGDTWPTPSSVDAPGGN